MQLQNLTLRRSPVDEYIEFLVPSNYRVSIDQLPNRSVDFKITAPDGQTLVWNSGVYIACGLLSYGIGVGIWAATEFKPKVFELVQKATAFGCTATVKYFEDGYGTGGGSGGDAGGGGSSDNPGGNSGGGVIVIPQDPPKTPGGYWQPVPTEPPGPPIRENEQFNMPPIEDEGSILRASSSVNEAKLTFPTDSLDVIHQAAVLPNDTEIKKIDPEFDFVTLVQKNIPVDLESGENLTASMQPGDNKASSLESATIEASVIYASLVTVDGKIAIKEISQAASEVEQATSEHPSKVNTRNNESETLNDDATNVANSDSTHVDNNISQNKETIEKTIILENYDTIPYAQIAPENFDIEITFVGIQEIFG